MTNALNDLAPYPPTADQATADAVARAHTIRAQAGFLRNMDHAYFTSLPGQPGHDEVLADWQRNLGEMVGHFKAAFLTRALIEHAGQEVADEVTRQIHDALDDGGAVGEWLWAWLAGYGIDPVKVAGAVEAERASKVGAR
jgi:hypothetical protein